MAPRNNYTVIYLLMKICTTCIYSRDLYTHARTQIYRTYGERESLLLHRYSCDIHMYGLRDHS